MQAPQASPSNPQKVTSLGKIILKNIFILIKSYGTSPREKIAKTLKKIFFSIKAFNKNFHFIVENYFYLFKIIFILILYVIIGTVVFSDCAIKLRDVFLGNHTVLIAIGLRDDCAIVEFTYMSHSSFIHCLGFRF
jgi:hypothetical protein